jgi:hypothetical protein
MNQQHKVKNDFYFDDKKKENYSEKSINKDILVGMLRPLSYTAETNSSKQRYFFSSKLILFLKMFLLYTYIVSAGQTFGEIVGEVGSLNTVPHDNFEDVKEADLPEAENVDEIDMVTKMECEIIREFCEEVEQFEKYLNDFLENF